MEEVCFCFFQPGSPCYGVMVFSVKFLIQNHESGKNGKTHGCASLSCWDSNMTGVLLRR